MSVVSEKHHEKSYRKTTTKLGVTYTTKTINSDG